jgi:hypothetical protein
VRGVLPANEAAVRSQGHAGSIQLGRSALAFFLIILYVYLMKFRHLFRAIIFRILSWQTTAPSDNLALDTS